MCFKKKLEWSGKELNYATFSPSQNVYAYNDHLQNQVFLAHSHCVLGSAFQKYVPKPFSLPHILQ